MSISKPSRCGDAPPDRRQDACNGCKFWSEIAKAVGLGRIEALCLNPKSQHYSKYVHRGCLLREAGRPIDDPRFAT